MALESLLNSVKWVDEQVLREYTKIGRQFNLDEGRKKYFVGISFVMTHIIISSVTGDQLIGAAELPARTLLNVPDFAYNIWGSIGNIKDEATSETKAIDPITNLYRRFNSVVRLPTFVAGAGLVGKFGADLFNYLTNGEPIDSNSYNYLMYGSGLLSLASSMYIKDTDPKLLDKEPFWKKADIWVKEKWGSLTPQPAPQPVTVQPHAALENYIQAQPPIEKSFSSLR